MENNTDQLSVDPLPFFSKVCENIRENMNKQVELKSKDEPADETEMTKLTKEGSFSFLTLKQLNRLAQIRCKNVKESTAEAKQKLDGYYLTLQNLQYEIGHLHREITKCLEFRSRHESIPLVDVNQFYSDAPSEISMPEKTMDDQHTQTLARLDWELEQRKRLAAEVNKLEAKKEVALSQINKKKQDLQMLAPCLENLLKASLPLQEAFDLPIEKSKSDREAANLLPRPLFVLFVQAKSYQEACDPNILVEIQGDFAAANKMKQVEDKRSSVTFVGSNQSEEDTESDQDDVDEQDMERSRKKHKKSSKKMKMETDGKSSNLKVHPLHVTITLTSSPQHPNTEMKVELKFFYFTQLKFASVKTTFTLPDAKNKDSPVLEDNNFLSCLMSDDHGIEIPNPGASQLASANKWSVSSSLAIYGRPYLWAQHMCGLDFIATTQPVGDDMQRSFTNVAACFKLIRARVVARLSLDRQLVSLGEDSSLTMDKWIRVTWSEHRKLDRNKQAIEMGVCGKHDCLYEGAVKRKTVGGDKLAHLYFSVAIPADYPHHSPLFTCRVELGSSDKRASNDYNLRAIERMINVHLPQQVKDKNQLLSAQLLKLCELFDLWVETSVMEGATEFGPSMIHATSKRCPVPHSGPDRLKPLNYDPDRAIYHH